MARTLFFRMVFRKFSEITKNKPIFSQYNIFYNYEYFSFQFAFRIIAKEVKQIRKNVVCVQLVLFSFCCALTTGRCYAFQHKLVNYKKSEFYGPYVQIILFLVIMVNVCLIKLLKKHNHKKSNCVFFTTFKTFKSSSFCNIFNFHSGFV